MHRIRSFSAVPALLAFVIAAWAQSGLAATRADAVGLPGVVRESRPSVPVQAAPTAEQAALDREARTRLQALFARIDALSEVEVTVEAGVAHLGGTAFSMEAREEAVRLARETDGVAYVEDGMRVETDLGERLRPTLGRIRDFAMGGAAFLPLLAVALLVVVVFTAVGRILAGWERGPHLRWTRNPFLRGLARQGVAFVFAVTGLLVALELLDATALVGAVLGTAGVFGLAIGFAFKDIVENHLAGLLLSVRRPFDPSDLISVGEYEGQVVRLTARETILMTLAGNHVRIPNAEVFRGVMVNYTRNKLRRFDFEVAVATTDDLVRAQNVGRRALADMRGVLDEPEPASTVSALGDSWVTLTFFGWVDQRVTDFRRVRSEAIRLVNHALEEAGVTMPSPEYALVIRRHADAPGGGSTMETPVTGAAGEAPSDVVPEPPQQDVSVDRSLDEQIDADRRVSDEEDLLQDADDASVEEGRGRRPDRSR